MQAHGTLALQQPLGTARYRAPAQFLDLPVDGGRRKRFRKSFASFFQVFVEDGRGIRSKLPEIPDRSLTAPPGELAEVVFVVVDHQHHVRPVKCGPLSADTLSISFFCSR